jgi:hypothetical protein
MTIVSVSRKKICAAIAKEPTTTLVPQHWVAGRKYTDQVKSRDCYVCAVGAVMRNALLHPKQPALSIGDAASAAVSAEGGSCDAGADAVEEAENGSYMSALSAFFETEAEYRGINQMGSRTRKRKEAMKKLKKDCIKFVKKNFPSKLEIDIDGARPAKDVKIVDED